MAKKTNTVNVAVTADAKKFRKEFQKASKEVGKFQKAAKKAFKAFAKVGIGAAIGIGVAFGKAALDFEKMENVLIKGTGATGDALEGLKTQAMDVMKTVPESAEVIAGAIADVNTHLGLTGEDLEKTSRLFLDFARITEVDVGMAVGQLDAQLTQFGLGVGDTEEVMGDLIRISQATGVPMEKLLKQMEKYGPVFATVGFSIEETTALFGQLERAGIDMKSAAPALQMFFDKAAKAGEDPKKALAGVVAEIENATTVSDKLNLATAAFGSEGAQRMVSAIQSGNFELETFGGLMGEGVGIVDAQAAATQTLTDKFNILKNKVLVAIGPIAVRAMDAMMGALDDLMPHVDTAIERIKEFVKTEDFQEFKDTVVDVLKVVGEKIAAVAKVFGKWIQQNPKKFLSGLAFVIGTVMTAAVWSLVTSLTALLASISLPVAAIALFAAGVAWAYQNVDSFKESVDRWVDSAKLLGEVLKDIWNWFANFDLGAVWASISEAVITAFDDTINHVADLTTRITDALYDGLWRFTEWGEDITVKIIDGIGDIAGKIKQKIMDLGGSIYAIGLKMKQWGTDLGRSLINGIIDIWNRADLRMPRVEVPDWVPKIGGKGFGGFDIFPDIPALAAGGIIDRPGGMLALIGEAGPEAVVPLDGRHGMGGTQNITINVTGVSGEEVIEAIRRETQRRGAAVFPTVAGRRT